MLQKDHAYSCALPQNLAISGKILTIHARSRTIALNRA
jgi:hypothetical protein